MRSPRPFRSARRRERDDTTPRLVAVIDHCAQLSGGELALLRLVPALDDIEVRVILGEDGPLVEKLRNVGTTVDVLPLDPSVRHTNRAEVIPGRAAIGRVTKTWRDIGALRVRLREIDPDLVHTNSLKAAVYGGIAAKLEGIPVVWHIRDRIARDYLPGSAVLAIRGLALVIPRCIVFNSKASRSACNVPVAFRVIPSPVIYDSAAGRARLDTAIRRPSRFAMVGRLAPWKGQHVFLRAFAQAFPEGDETAIIAGSAMFGEDEYARDLGWLAAELGIADRVTFAGFVDDIPALLVNTDALIHASVIAEPFGQVVIEGMAAGLPVVATAAGGPLEVITDGIDGLLVTPDSVDALARTLRRLRDDPELCHRLGQAAFVRAQDFQADKVAAQIRESWTAVLAYEAARRHRPVSR